jgi:hypothetical protein
MIPKKNKNIIVMSIIALCMYSSLVAYQLTDLVIDGGLSLVKKYLTYVDPSLSSLYKEQVQANNDWLTLLETYRNKYCTVGIWGRLRGTPSKTIPKHIINACTIQSRWAWKVKNPSLQEIAQATAINTQLRTLILDFMYNRPLQDRQQYVEPSLAALHNAQIKANTDTFILYDTFQREHCKPGIGQATGRKIPDYILREATFDALIQQREDPTLENVAELATRNNRFRSILCKFIAGEQGIALVQ